MFLLLAVVVGLAHTLQIVGIPEQPLVAVVLLDVVSHRTVGFRMLADAEHLGLLAGVVVPPQDLATQLLPSGGLVPAAPADVLITLAKPRLLVTRRSAYSCREHLDLWLQRFQTPHATKQAKAPGSRLAVAQCYSTNTTTVTFCDLTACLSFWGGPMKRESVTLTPSHPSISRGFPNGGSITLHNPQGQIHVDITIDGAKSILRRHGDSVVLQSGENAMAELNGNGIATLDVVSQ